MVVSHHSVGLRIGSVPIWQHETQDKLSTIAIFQTYRLGFLTFLRL